MAEGFDPEIELSKVVLANVLLGPSLFGGIRKLKENDELVLVSAVYNNKGYNFYITIKQLLQYLQKTYNKGKPCRDLKDIKKCFSGCLHDLYNDRGARFLGIDGFCAYLYTKMYDIIEKEDQLFRISFIEKEVDAKTLHVIDTEALLGLFSDDYNDVNFECDTKTYVIDNYPISQQEQEKVFNDFKEQPWVLYIEDNDTYGNDNEIKNFLSPNIFKYNDDKTVTIINDPQFDNGILIFNQKKVKEYNIFGSKTQQFYLPSRGHIIKHIVQQSGLKKSEKYCNRDNFVRVPCRYTNNYGSCGFIESSFAVEKGGIYDVSDEEKQKLQQGEAIDLRRRKFQATSHYKLESRVDNQWENIKQLVDGLEVLRHENIAQQYCNELHMGHNLSNACDAIKQNIVDRLKRYYDLGYTAILSNIYDKEHEIILQNPNTRQCRGISLGKEEFISGECKCDSQFHILTGVKYSLMNDDVDKQLFFHNGQQILRLNLNEKLKRQIMAVANGTDKELPEQINIAKDVEYKGDKNLEVGFCNKYFGWCCNDEEELANLQDDGRDINVHKL